MSIQWYLISVLAAFTGGTLAMIFLWVWSRKLRRFRRPVTEKMLRPPGNSLRAQIESMDDDLLSCLVVAMLLPPLLAACTSLHGALIQPVQTVQALSGAVVGMVAWVPCCWFLMRTVRRRRERCLGYSGELLVAEQLQELARMGCYIFHDLQPKQTWNIDHIIVAPDSVLVVETKTRTKRELGRGSRAHEVVFDGRQLHFPRWSDTDGLAQAERNAGWVRDYLAKALAEVVKVEAVLTLPGWMVRRKGRGRVCVVNPKEMRALVRARGGQAISPEKETRMRRIAHALEQRCRDVDF